MRKIILLISLPIFAQQKAMQQTKAFETLQNIMEYIEDFGNGHYWVPTNILPTTYIKKLREEYAQYNPYNKTDSWVSNGQISPEEKAFIDQRKALVAQQLSVFCKKDVPADKALTIGICATGGSYRAMIGSLAVLYFLQTSQLAKAITYFCALSGSTWGVSHYISSQQELDVYIQKVQKNMLNNIRLSADKGLLQPITEMTTLRDMCNNLSKKFVFYQRISAVDIWGALISNNILNHCADVQQLRISDQASIIVDKQFFLPIYTAICPYKDSYEWYECTPFDVRDIENNNYVKTWAFGRKYENGISKPAKTNNDVAYPKEFSLSNFMGVFGSAFTLNIKDMIQIMKEDGQLSMVENYMLNSIISIDEKLLNISNFRIMPARFTNFNAGLKNAQNAHEKEILLIDAGIDNSFPMYPLLQPERHLDIIIMIDMSSDVPSIPSLQEINEYVQTKNLPVSTIDVTKITKKQAAYFAEPNKTSIIYIPFSDACLDAFCNVYNFYYTQNEFDTVFNTINAIANASLPAIMQLITTKQDQKMLAS